MSGPGPRFILNNAVRRRNRRAYMADRDVTMAEEGRI